jgi:hypothetical protein
MVIYVEDYWNTLMEVHDKQLFHAGYRKTFHKACHSIIVTVIDISYVLLLHQFRCKACIVEFLEVLF